MATDDSAFEQPGGSVASRQSLALRHRWLFDWASPWEYTAHAVHRQIYQSQSRFQCIEIVETEGYGRCLLLDGEVQSFETDEYIYHESLVHPALCMHPAPRRVLVVGGGEGATLREVLRHRAVESAVMVDIDEQLIAAAREHLPSFHQGSFADPRVTMHFGDGRTFIERSTDHFDVVVIDVTNPMAGGPSYKLFTVEFYEAVRSRLRPGGLAVLQSSSATLGGLDSSCAIYHTVRTAFPRAVLWAAFLPAYTTDWSFTMAGTELIDPLSLSVAEIDRRVADRLSHPLRYYDGVTHHRLFHLPRYVRDALQVPAGVSRDRDPLQEALPGYLEA